MAAKGKRGPARPKKTTSSRPGAVPPPEALRAVVDGLPDVVFDVAPDGTVRWLNATFERLTGWTREEWVGRPFEALLHPDDLPLARQRITQRAAGGESQAHELRFQHKDGSWVSGEVAITVSVADGVVTGITGVGRDLSARRRAEEALEGSRRLLATTQAIAHMGSWELDVASGRLTWSDELYRIYGFPPGHPPDYPAFLSFVHPEDRATFPQPGAQKADWGLWHEFRFIRPDGQERTIRTRGGAIADARGRVVRLAGMSQDVTDLMRSERRLAQLAAIVQWSADAIIGTNLEGRITEWNPAAERLFGYTAAEAIGKFARMFVPDDRRDEHASIFERLRARQPVPLVETVRRRKDGTLVPVALTVAPILDAEGNVSGASATLRDITEQKRAMESLRQSETSYRALVENASYGIYRSSAAGRFLAVNRAMVQMLGYDTEEELLELDLRTDLYVDPAQRDLAIARYGASEVVAGADVEWRRRDGTPITVRLNGHGVRGADGALAYFEMIAENVTERRALEAQVRRAQQMEALGQLTGGIAHDFNNLLTVVQTTADLLATSLPADRADLMADVASLRVTARRGAALVKQLMAFGRRDMLQRAKLDLGQHLAAFVSTLRRVLPEHIDIRFHTAPGLPPVYADAGAVEQIVLHLGTNARDAMPNGGVLRIDLQRVQMDEAHRAVHGFGKAGHYVCVAVSDTGMGMDADTKARIFDPFFTTKAPGSGTGLGLPTVYSIAQQHDGFIQVYSEPGQGTTIRVYLPVFEVAAPATGTAPAQLKGGTETVLLVEDEEGIRRAAQRVLQKFGYQVLTAGDGEEALGILRRESPVDLVLTDLVMPKLGGRGLYDAVRQSGGHQRFLFVSGYTARDVQESAQIEEGMRFLSKPWTLPDLIGQVREALDAPVS